MHLSLTAEREMGIPLMNIFWIFCALIPCMTVMLPFDPHIQRRSVRSFETSLHNPRSPTNFVERLKPDNRLYWTSGDLALGSPHS